MFLGKSSCLNSMLYITKLYIRKILRVPWMKNQYWYFHGAPGTDLFWSKKRAKN